LNLLQVYAVESFISRPCLLDCLSFAALLQNP
jgi:hypothetical protein